MRNIPLILLGLLTASIYASETTPTAPDPSRVLVLRNGTSPVSCAIADDYAKRRAVPNILTVYCQDAALSATAETIAYAAVRHDIEDPLRVWLAAHPGVDVIVLTKGIPIRISDAPGLGLGDCRPSLDSWLAALDYGSKPGAVPVRLVDGGFTGNAWSNRFWRSEEHFSHSRHGGYLVSRLDGYTQADAIALTTRSLSAGTTTGTVLLDACPDFGFDIPARQPLDIAGSAVGTNGRMQMGELDFKAWNADLEHAADLLKARGITAVLDRSGIFAAATAPLAGYASWGSNDKHFSATTYAALRFAPGALCETAVSTSARTFLTTTGGQSLIADLIAQGVTGAKGYTDEPLLQAVASPSILFDRWARGWPLVECYFAASRFVAWEDVVIGDPLCQRKTAAQ